jgi:hypothetical protein
MAQAPSVSATCTIEANHPSGITGDPEEEDGMSGIGIDPLIGKGATEAKVKDYVHWTAKLTYPTDAKNSVRIEVTPGNNTPGSSGSTSATSGGSTTITEKGKGKVPHISGANPGDGGLYYIFASITVNPSYYIYKQDSKSCHCH